VPTSDQRECMLSNCSTISNCQTCSSSTCSSCRIGYSLSADKTSCSSNICTAANCLYCSSNSTCLRCLSSFILVAGVCKTAYCNLPFCSSCKQQSMFCDSCMSGYSWNVWTNQCEKQIVLNCDSIGSISRMNYQCFSCPSNQTCNQCSASFTYQNATQSCATSCNIVNCVKCLTSQLCTMCATGFVLDQNLLSCKLKCSVANCTQCLSSTTVCDKCATGFMLVNNLCQEDTCKIDNCLVCASRTACASCQAMF
jgi:hypothetical protein